MSDKEEHLNKKGRLFSTFELWQIIDLVKNFFIHE